MKLYDFDGMFDLKLSEYIRKNPDRYTESEWEDLIPKFYESFGDTYIKSVGDTPNGFYSKLSDKELVSALSAHLKKNVPVSKFFRYLFERADAVELLTPLLDGGNAEKEYAVNLIGANDGVLKKYLSMLVSPDCGEELRNILSEILKEKADIVADEASDYYERGVERELMLEILARSVIRNDKIFDILIKEFKSNPEKVSANANLLARYGDERALKYLLEKIDEEDVSYLEYKELLLAIESLGGTYERERDFSDDPYYELLKCRDYPAKDIFVPSDKK